MPKPFASSADTSPKSETLEVLADGVYALTSEGDPNVGAVEGEDFLVCFDARATPASARDWLDALREHTDKPVKYLVLSHYHAVRALGASAFGASEVVMHVDTLGLVRERGEQDWASEFARMPRLFKEPESIPGLTWPTLCFDGTMSISLGGDRGDLVLGHAGRGHTRGDAYLWLPDRKILFAGDLIESEAALYTGDAYHREWLGTLENLELLEAEVLVGGRGAVVHGREGVTAAITQTRGFLLGLTGAVASVHEAGGDIRAAFDAAHRELEPTYGKWPIFEHCLPFDVQRFWDELDGVEHPTIWTPERDREVWALLQDRG
ncbi:MBL fold metallo-hydrolase [Allokutzneria multivorans]|uniref:MBL fold metallo-hydrolase n=1 Tax=Allokutzneria multivorans TaxID=1142134 RepID=A0ABP7RP07_9PSEU